MVLFCLKSYNIVAPYENSDDDYTSKMEKITVAFIQEVTISESEIAEFEKPKVKEVKPKDVEVEKPEVPKKEKVQTSEIEKVKVPRGSSATMYYSQMYINNKMYNIEVLYDELTNTVYHFEHARKAMGNLPAIKR